MRLFKTILMLLVIFFVASMIGTAIFQSMGYFGKGGPLILGLMAGLLYLMFFSNPKENEKNDVALYPEENRRKASFKIKPPRAPSSDLKPSDDTLELTTSDLEKWSKEFSILYEYDENVRGCHDELKNIDTQMAEEFRNEVVSDRKNAAAIRGRLLEAHDKKTNPFSSQKLNEALSQARLLGEAAEKEFVRVVEVMGKDIETDLILDRLKEKYKVLEWPEKIGGESFVEVYLDYGIYTMGDCKYFIYSNNIRKAGGTVTYGSVKKARGKIDQLPRNRWL